MSPELAAVITSGIIGASAIIVVALIKRNGKIDPPEKCDPPPFCPEHSGILAQLKNMELDITEIKGDVKDLLKRE